MISPGWNKIEPWISTAGHYFTYSLLCSSNDIEWTLNIRKNTQYNGLLQTFLHMILLTWTSDLIIVVLVIQTATFLQGDTSASFEYKAWFTEAATDTGTRTVGGRFHTGGNTGWPTVYILCIRRAWLCTAEMKGMWWWKVKQYLQI